MQESSTSKRWSLQKILAIAGLYWTIWSDYIVHKIHRRVLEHIKSQAESAIKSREISWRSQTPDRVSHGGLDCLKTHR
jgi:hypothetical protein